MSGIGKGALQSITQPLFGRLLVWIALKLQIPIFLVYYCILGIALLVATIVEGIEMLSFFFMSFGLIFTVLFGVVYPVVWGVRTDGYFWRVPDEEAAKLLRG